MHGGSIIDNTVGYLERVETWPLKHVLSEQNKKVLLVTISGITRTKGPASQIASLPVAASDFFPTGNSTTHLLQDTKEATTFDRHARTPIEVE